MGASWGAPSAVACLTWAAFRAAPPGQLRSVTAPTRTAGPRACPVQELDGARFHQLLDGGVIRRLGGDLAGLAGTEAELLSTGQSHCDWLFALILDVHLFALSSDAGKTRTVRRRPAGAYHERRPAREPVTARAGPCPGHEVDPEELAALGYPCGAWRRGRCGPSPDGGAVRSMKRISRSHAPRGSELNARASGTISAVICVQITAAHHNEEHP